MQALNTAPCRFLTRAFVGTLFMLTVVFGTLVWISPVHAATRSANLDFFIEQTPVGETVPVILYLDNRLTMDEVYPVARTLPMTERRQYVVRVLKERFQDMGGGVMDRLEVARKAGQVSLLRPLWILNAVRAHATPEIIDEIDKNYREVVYITPDPVHENTLDEIGWGVADMDCPDVWAQYGDGTGVIVGHKDSGTDLTHPGYAGRHWVNPGEDLNGNGTIDAGESNGVDDDGNGYIDDFYGWNFDYDNNDVNDHDGSRHGTRTGSVITSNFTPCDTVCVAPGAKLMELAGYKFQGAVFEASQYAVEMGAHVISASLSFKQSDCNEYNDCPNYVAHRFVSEMELAAGLLHANSGGNSGLANPIPLSFPAPSNCPPPLLYNQPQSGGVSSIISVNAYGIGGLFSSGAHGPSAWSSSDMCVHPLMPFCGPEGQGNSYPEQFNDYPYMNALLPGLLRPDVIAPTSVRCLSYGGGCSTIGGTSGATPHVGGVCALIFSAFPGITPENAYRLLVSTAVDGGIPGVDSLFGFGKIRPLLACNAGAAQMTLVIGRVSEDDDGLENVRITSDVSAPIETNPNGDYLLWLPNGTHQVRYKKYPFTDVTREIVASGGTTTEDVAMVRAPAAFVTGFVTGNGIPLEDILVTFTELPLTVNTNVAGQFTADMAAGTYEVVLGGLPWETLTTSVDIQAGNDTVYFSLTRSVQALPSGPDQFGHFLYDNYDADTVRYNWIEINPDAGGLPGEVVNVGDDNTVVRTLPFTFRFYGQDFTQITISANGFIVLGSSSSNVWHEHFIPCPDLPNRFLAPFFDDWQPQDMGGDVLYYTATGLPYVVIEWYDVIHYYEQGPVRFQAILYDPLYWSGYNGEGVALYQYHTMNNSLEGVVGVENGDGTDGIQYRFQLQYDTHASPIVPGTAIMVISDSTLETEDLPVAELPREFALYQNYPNPFNPLTTFRWSVPRAARVRLALYDVLGREAAVVFEGISETGMHEQVFDARGLATGIYFARLESERQSLAVRKIMLLK
ncbi:MAG: S8 family serine peptidase [Calditrichota bacterium]